MTETQASPIRPTTHRPLRGPQEPRQAHVTAVTRTLRWADQAAAQGDYADALAWLGVLRAIGEPLPAGYDAKRDLWLRSLGDPASGQGERPGGP